MLWGFLFQWWAGVGGNFLRWWPPSTMWVGLLSFWPIGHWGIWIKSQGYDFQDGWGILRNCPQINAWSVPSHYLNQCCNIVNSNLKNKLEWNLKQNSYNFIQDDTFENVVWKMASVLSWPQCVKVDVWAAVIFFQDFEGMAHIVKFPWFDDDNQWYQVIPNGLYMSVGEDPHQLISPSWDSKVTSLVQRLRLSQQGFDVFSESYMAVSFGQLSLICRGIQGSFCVCAQPVRDDVTM